MKIYDVDALAADARAAHPSRPATAIVHDSPDARLVLFRIDRGQEVAPHTSGSSVILSVCEGPGIVSDADGEREVRPGQVVAYNRGELHGMRAHAGRFVVLAIITPRPGGR